MNKRKISPKRDQPTLAITHKITAQHQDVTPQRAPDNTHPINKNHGIGETVQKNKPANYNGSFGSMRLGTVNFFNEESGYGFIRDTMTKESFFVYRIGVMAFSSSTFFQLLTRPLVQSA